MKLKETVATVKRMLQENPLLRYSDEKLLAKYWEEEMVAGGFQKADFLNYYYTGFFTPAETIRRARQKIQQMYPELARKSGGRKETLQTEVKTELRSIEKDLLTTLGQALNPNL